MVSILRSIGGATCSILLAKGRVDFGFKWNLSAMIIQLPLLTIGVYLYDVIGVVMALLVFQVIFTSLNYFLLIRKLIDLRFNNYIMSILPFFIISLVMASFTWLIGYFLVGFPM